MPLKFFVRLAPAALVLASGLVVRSEAQIRPDCTSGCVTYSVSVTGGGSITRPINSGPYTATFLVQNTGNVTDTYTFTCSRSGGITCGAVSPGSATLSPGGGASAASIEGATLATWPTSITVSVSYTVGSSSGSLTLKATGAGPTPPTSSATLQVTAQAPPGAPVVALRNFAADNLDRGLCLTAGAGEAAAFSCGDLVVSHSMPGYATMSRERSLTLIYNSATALPQPVVVASVREGGTVDIPDSVIVELTVDGALKATSRYPGANWGTGATTTRQVSVSYDASDLLANVTGIHPFSLRVRNQYGATIVDATPITGNLMIVDRRDSEFGAGVGIAGVERLYLGQPGNAILWVGGDGSSKVYTPSGTNMWVAPAGTFRDQITLANSKYTRALRHNVKVVFDDLGQHVQTVSRYADTTTFVWDPTTHRLTKIFVPPGSQFPGTKYALSYTTTAGKFLQFIDDPALRRLYVSINETTRRLMTLTDPDDHAVTFTYYANGLLKTRTNRRRDATTYEYANNLRLTKVTIPVGRSATDATKAIVQFMPWDEKGRTTAVDTAKAYTTILGPRYPSVTDTAAIWVDRFGAPTRIVNPLGFTTNIERGDNAVPALVTKLIYPNREVIRMAYDARGNLMQVRDSTSHLGADSLPTKATVYTYGSGKGLDSPLKVVDSASTADSSVVTQFVNDPATGLPTKITGPNGHVTLFAYNPANQVKAVDELDVRSWDQAQTAKGAPDTLHYGFAFNSLGNVTSDTGPTPSKRVRKYARDAAQRVGDVYDPLNHHVTYFYDPLNRVTAVVEDLAVDLVTRTVYDTDVVASVTDPGGVTAAGPTTRPGGRSARRTS